MVYYLNLKTVLLGLLNKTKILNLQLKKAEFSGYWYGSFANKTLDARTLKQNPIRTTNGSGVVRVFIQIIIYTIQILLLRFQEFTNGTHNGITHTDINGTYTSISNITLDSFDITTSGTANATGDIGGNAITSTQNRQFDVLNIGGLSITYRVPGTNINAFVRTTSSKSIHGTQSPYIYN